MDQKYVLVDKLGRYLAPDFETWVVGLPGAVRFIPGAALNACVERWRRHGVRVEPAPRATT